MAAHLPNEILHALGTIVVSWARVEALLAEFLSYLLKADRGYMYVLNQDVASSAQIKWVRILVDERFANEDVRKGLSDLLDRIDDARVGRNSLIHGLWINGPEIGTALVQTIKLGRAEIARTECITASDLHYLFRDIEAMGDELQTVLTNLSVI